MNSGTVPAGIHNDPDHNLATPTPMNQPSYVPPKIADFALWLDNLASLVAANPTDYGLVPGDATIISGAKSFGAPLRITGDRIDNCHINHSVLPGANKEAVAVLVRAKGDGAGAGAQDHTRAALESA